MYNPVGEVGGAWRFGGERGPNQSLNQRYVGVHLVPGLLAGKTVEAGRGA